MEDLERRERWEKRRQARKKQIIRRCSTVAVCVIALLLFVTVGWKALGSVISSISNNKAKTEENTVVQAAAAPEDEGKKVAMVSTDGAKVAGYDTPGWQMDETGWWYGNEDGSYYINGWMTIDNVDYYFGEDGYMAANGWVNIDGDDYYFDENGAYQPDAQQQMVAMTFDDGPSANTDHLLDILTENNSKATFFMVGTQIEEYPETVQKMASLGMELGNHTWDHTYLNKSTPAERYQKFAQVDAKLKELTGQEASVFRSPGGGESDEYRAGISKPLILWNVDTLDWKNKDVNMNISAVLDNAADGDIILMHDLYEPTVTACETIIPELRKRGFKLVTVEELAAAKGKTLEAGVDYFSFGEEYVDKTAE
ncbi:MAG: polysaccharide deacetylase family protein [Lachnospiraceae bacterium]|nr:polysaccharide deacetylase family protein [Lachnospiraceae bacterium]